MGRGRVVQWLEGRRLCLHSVPSEGRAPENAHLQGVWTGIKRTIREERCKPQSPLVCSSRGAWLQAAGPDEKGQGGLGEARAVWAAQFMSECFEILL